MQYSVEIYIDENGTRGQLAGDGFGNDLLWTNYNAVCVTSTNCQNSVLPAGQFLGPNNGVSILKNYDNSTLEWIPNAGTYFVVVTVSSNVLGDPGNNEQSISVTVRDYYDVSVDLTWTNSGVPVSGGVEGGGDKDFRITVSLDSGIPGMTIRNATVTMSYDNVGTLDAGTFTVGQENIVNVEETLGDASSVKTETRLVIGGTPGYTGVANGSIMPPTVSSG
jgi:hypothetical protein